MEALKKVAQQDQASAPYIKFAQPAIDDATAADVAAVLKSLWIATGPKVAALEAALSEYFGGRATRVMTSATAAMEIALEVCGIGAGDEVIMSAQSFFSTVNMAVKVGATPVFVDCDLESRAIDLAAVEAAITPRTKAVMPTHFPGALGDMDALYALAKKHNLRVIEDAALVQGSLWKGQPIGSFGDIATFSFHPNKNMTTIEGGAIVVNNQQEAEHVERLRFHGIKGLPDGTRDVLFAAGKSNMSDVSAAVGLRQLAKLDDFLAKRKVLVLRYFELFSTLEDVVLPAYMDDDQSWGMFCVLFPFDSLGITRQEFRRQLHERGIGTGMSYEALHLTTLGKSFGGREGQYPNAERIARETVTLPLHVNMSLADVDRVFIAVAEILQQAKAR